jgi:hypothetical protein
MCSSTRVAPRVVHFSSTIVGALHSTGDVGPVNVSMCTVDERGPVVVPREEVRGAVLADVDEVDVVAVVRATVVEVVAPDDVLVDRLLTDR